MTNELMEEQTTEPSESTPEKPASNGRLGEDSAAARGDPDPGVGRGLVSLP